MYNAYCFAQMAYKQKHHSVENVTKADRIRIVVGFMYTFWYSLSSTTSILE